MSTVMMTSTGVASAHQKLITKCCAQILTLMHTVLESAEMCGDVYTELHGWLVSLADRPIAANEEVGRALFRLIFLIAGRHFAPLCLVKNVALDLANFTRRSSLDENDANDSAQSAFSTRPLAEHTVRFKFVNGAGSVLDYARLCKEAVQSTLDECSWLLTSSLAQHVNSVFHPVYSLELICKLLHDTVLIITYMLRSVSGVLGAELTLELMLNFYDFLSTFFQSVL